jgi:hypothetical protein
MFKSEYSLNSEASVWLNQLKNGLIQINPKLRNVNALLSKPEFVKNCPDDLHSFVEMLMPLMVDNEPFTWEGHEYLIEPYKAFNFPEEKNEDGKAFVWMCGAQVGKSIAAMLLMMFLAIKFWGKYQGYFLPTADMAMIFSGDRFKPMALGIPQIAEIWGEDPTAEEGISGKKSDQKRVRSIGPSLMFFNSMAGKTATESIPMLSLCFDEVRRMVDADIERAKERISHSSYPITFELSTAGYPDANIDRAYRASTQNKFHSKCGCKDGVVLSDVFPDCIGERLGGVTAALKDMPKRFWVCPRCGEPVKHVRDGKWIEHNPGALSTGYHIAQTLSCRQNADKIFNSFLRATDITEFYNSKLGIPHISKEAQIVDLDILRATVNPNLRWSHTQSIKPNNCSMGVDQMFGFNVVVIRYRGPKDENSGLHKSRLAHIEWVVDVDPWKRCAELMSEYDVSCCVADAMPNANEALRFAKAFPGRVFLADYSYEGGKGLDICQWGDRVQGDHNKKADQEIKDKRRVRISRFHGIEWNLTKYVNRQKEQPHEKGLLMPVPDLANRPQQVFICEDVFWAHMTKIARRKKVINEEQSIFKMVFENIGIDPHFVHADLYAELGLTRLKDRYNSAFGNYAQQADVVDELAHVWFPVEGEPSRFHCDKCNLTVSVRPGVTAQDTADKNGYGKCQEYVH